MTHDLVCRDVSKRFRIRGPAADGPPTRLGTLFDRRRRWTDFWAVRNVSFEVERGEALGIIGRNGAGKSTLLKLLWGITAPTRGEIRIHGRLSGLVEVGTGFHPELTGRENVYLYGSILGMRRREITEKLERIVDFAGVRPFIDTPVKRYSSGMYVRLGFAIAAHLDPDILLLDEVLAVGDAPFQTQCFERIAELRRQGTTIVFISHDLGAVERLCSRVLLMQRGEMVSQGPPRSVIGEYLDGIRGEPEAAPETAKPRPVRVTSVDVSGTSAAGVTRTGEPVTVRVQYVASAPTEDVVVEVAWWSIDGMTLHSVLTTIDAARRLDLAPGAGTVEFLCPEVGLAPAVYSLSVGVRYRSAPPVGAHLHFWNRCAAVRVDPGRPVYGFFHMPHTFTISARSPAATVNGDGTDVEARDARATR